MIHQIIYNEKLTVGYVNPSNRLGHILPINISVAGDIIIQNNAVYRVINGTEVLIAAASELPNKVEVKTVETTDRKVW